MIEDADASIPEEEQQIVFFPRSFLLTNDRSSISTLRFGDNRNLTSDEIT